MDLVKIQHGAKVKGKGARADVPPAGASLEHDCRTSSIEHPDRERGNEQIDPNRTHLNYDLAAPLRERLYGGANAIEVYRSKYKAACDKYKEDTGKALRADAVTIMSWVVTAPKDLSEEYHEDFFRGAYEWFVERYGEENVIAANVHMDETTPHMHFKFMPFVPDGKHGGVKLCAKGLESSASMKKMHPELQKVLSERLGVEVNLLNGSTEHGSKTVIGLKIETLSNRLSELQQSIANGTADKETIIAEVEKIKVELTEYQAKQETLNKRPPERPEPYIPEVPTVGESKGEFRRRVKAAEKDHKAWERENKAREKWDKEHPEGYQKYTAGAVLSLRARNEKDRENIDKEIDRRFAARERSVSAREEAVNEIEYKRFVAPIVARNAIIQAFQRQGVELDLPTYGIQQAIQEHHRSAPKREEMARLKQSAETKDAPAKSNTKENHHER